MQRSSWLFLATLVALSAPATAGAEGDRGFNRVTSFARSAEDGVGYGSGYVGLSAPSVNDPIVGYLFYYDNEAGGAADHMDIFNSNSNTYPRGYAYGQYDGCAYAYKFTNFYLRDSRPHSSECFPYSRGMSKASLFCSETGADGLCPAYGAYKEPLPVRTMSRTCTTFGNVGSALFGPNRATASSNGTNPITTLDAGTEINVRYVTKNRQWVMGKVPGVQFRAPGAPVADLNWMFIPRGCVS